MSIDVIDHHFAAKSPDDDAASHNRPKLLSRASNISMFAGTTTALTDVPTDEHTVLDHRDGLESSDTSSIFSKKPTLRSMNSNLELSMSQILSGNGDAVAANETSIGDVTQHTASSTKELSTKEVALLSEEEQLADFLSRRKHFLMLSAAGKPIYARHGTEQVLSGYMGIIQAIMGFYQESTIPDTLQSFSSPSLNVVMLVKGPVYIVSISQYVEKESTMRTQLEFLYDVVVSSLTSTSMMRCFDRGDNFDLGRLLVGSEAFLDKICDGLTYGRLHFDVLFGSLSVLRLRATLRQKLNNILAAHRPVQASLLYGMLAVDKKLVSILRPKGHSLYPADLRLVFETIWERGFEEGQEYWFPLCLPKFNSTGYLHIFVSFLAPSIVLVLIAADKDDFFPLQQMKVDVLRKMSKEGLVRDLIRARHSQVSTQMLGIDHVVEHFVFKCKSRVQYLAPDLETRQMTDRKHMRRRIGKRDLIRIYEELQNLHGQRSKLQIHGYSVTLAVSEQTEDVLALAWVTSEFELFVISTPPSHEQASDNSRVAELIGASNVIHQFIRREEGRVWLHDGLTF